MNMEFDKNYPWAKKFHLSLEEYEKWQKSGKSSSFPTWCLEENLLSPKTYFKWAKKEYQYAFLKEEFFKSPALSKSDFEKIKDKAKWSKEFMPVFVWNDVIFIGCVEKKDLKLDFKHRFVLTHPSSLESLWNLVQKEEKELVEEGFTLVKADVPATTFVGGKDFKTNTQLKAMSLKKDTPVIALKEETKESSPSEEENQEIKKESEEKTELPLAKLKEVTPLVALKEETEEKISSPDEEESQDVKKQSEEKTELPLAKLKEEKPLELKNKEEVLPEKKDFPLAKAELPEEEEKERKVFEEQEEFPERHVEEDEVLSPPLELKKKEESEGLKADVSLDEENNQKALSNQEEKPTEAKGSEATVYGTSTYLYDGLWKKASPLFSAYGIFEIKAGKIKFSHYFGNINTKGLQDLSIDFNKESLFKILKKGHTYHGFVIDNPINKLFFTGIGWTNYPKHATFIPLDFQDGKPSEIFIGLSLSPLMRKQWKDFEIFVFDFFQEEEKAS